MHLDKNVWNLSLFESFRATHHHKKYYYFLFSPLNDKFLNECLIKHVRTVQPVDDINMMETVLLKHSFQVIFVI